MVIEKNWTIKKPVKEIDKFKPILDEYEIDFTGKYKEYFIGEEIPSSISKFINHVNRSDITNLDVKKYLFEDNVLILCDAERRALKVVEFKYKNADKCENFEESEANFKKELKSLLESKNIHCSNKYQRLDYPKIEVEPEVIKESFLGSLMSQIETKPFVSLTTQAELDAQRAEANSKKYK